MAASKEELAGENDQLAAEVSRLTIGLEEVQHSFQNLEKTFVQSKGTFSLARYGALKDMIKKLTEKEAMKRVHSLTENHINVNKGAAGLLQKAKLFASPLEKEGSACTDNGPSSPPPAKTGGKLSGFFKKVMKVTGFSDDDPADIRNLCKEEIQRDNERKRREIQRLNRQGLRIYSKLEQLQRKYELSKAHAPPTRYQELKDMIKDVISDLKI